MIRIRFLLLLAASLGTTFIGTAVAQVDIVQKERAAGYQGGFLNPAIKKHEGFSFLVLGDFGRVGEYHQKAVARELGHAAVSLDAEFVVSVGDNFYPNGVASVNDYHWKSSFEEIYTHPNLYADWYVALGNHDYRGSIQAQIDYTNISRRWQMPAPYFSKKMKLDDGKTLLLVVMDTNPFIESYQKDPVKYPDLAQQDTAAQRQWLAETLSDPDPTISHRIVVGHHPLYSGGKRKTDKATLAFEASFADFFDQHKVDAYICGHEHDLQIIRPEGRYTTQLLSGAASEIRPSGNRGGTIFAAAEPGFMALTLSGNDIIVQTIKATATGSELLHEMTINQSNK